MSTNDAVTSASSTEKMIGCVKWFNNKAGYGFISLIDGENVGKEIFVHHTGIGVNEQQYKYLVQGEYVEFGLSKTKTETFEFQAGDVSGIKGGKLMCETRRDLRSARTQYKSLTPNENFDKPVVMMPKAVDPPKRNYKTQKDKGKVLDDEGNNWSYVSRTKKTDKPVTRSKV